VVVVAKTVLDVVGVGVGVKNSAVDHVGAGT
jgi:hypothetical protein